MATLDRTGNASGGFNCGVASWGHAADLAYCVAVVGNWASTLGLIRISLAYDRERLPIILGRIHTRGIPVFQVRPSRRDNRRHQWRVDA